MDDPETTARRDAEDSVRGEGFLSPWINRFIPCHRALDDDWFAYTDSLNRCAQAVVMNHEAMVVGLSTLNPMCIGLRTLMRALSGFQGAVLLAERGMTAEADTLSRGVYEAGFWLGYLAEHGEIARDALVADEMASQRGRFQLFREQAILSGVAPDDIAPLDERLSELKLVAKRQDIGDLAEKSGFAAFYPTYRQLCAAAVHQSLNSLHRFIKRNDDGSYSGHIMGPDQEGIRQSLSWTCHALLMNLAGFSELVGGLIQGEEVRVLLDRYKQLGLESKTVPTLPRYPLKSDILTGSALAVEQNHFAQFLGCRSDAQSPPSLVANRPLGRFLILSA